MNNRIKNELYESGLNMTEKDLDQILGSDGQLQVRQLMHGVVDEQMSMSWRSNLNSRLVAAVEARRRKRKIAWFLSPALGLGFAGALAIVMMANTKGFVQLPERTSTGAVEAKLVAAHQNDLIFSDVTGVGLNPEEVVYGKSAGGTSNDISEADLGSL